jgi:hypothetical protein
MYVCMYVLGWAYNVSRSSLCGLVLAFRMLQALSSHTASPPHSKRPLGLLLLLQPLALASSTVTGLLCPIIFFVHGLFARHAALTAVKGDCIRALAGNKDQIEYFMNTSFPHLLLMKLWLFCKPR